MILAPTTAPPQAQAEPLDSSIATSAEKTLHVHPLKSVEFASTQLLEDENGKNDETREFLERLKVPTVVLETQSISHTMAAALSLSLLGHTLFLKSQVPFPVAQLSRMPGGKSNPKVAKKRDELLATFDTLTSHLRTTFVALSTAYARCRLAKAAATERLVTTDENLPAVEDRSTTMTNTRRGTAHLMFVVGSSVNAARAKILLTIDGLDVKVWGARPVVEDEESDESNDEESSDSETSDVDEETDEESFESNDEDTTDDEGSDSGNASDAGSPAFGSEPPPSRSPSPSSPLIRSLAPSPESLPSPLPTLQPLPTAFTFTHPLPSSTRLGNASTGAASPQLIAPLPPPSQPSPTSASREPTPTPALSYAEEQQALRAAERLLSRTLMNAWVDGEGDMSSEIAPTQTHLYLRAPRRFVHPAWAARQNLTRTLDGVLDGFLEDAGAVPVPVGAKSKSKARRVRTEGAWIGCKGGSAFSSAKTQGSAREELEQQDEEDEEIWWAWEGKIVGFADW